MSTRRGEAGFNAFPFVIWCRTILDREKRRKMDRARLVLHGLLCEWKNAAMHLDSAERAGLNPPLFSIRELKGKWGTWSSERREISLSADLIRNHTWDAVREVLLHEMAHQLADQVFRAWTEPPHGQSFKKACRLLRANPHPSSGRPLLDERLSEGPAGGGGTILARIRKLMALAQSSNRFEAEAAMNKAHELMRMHQVEWVTGEERQDLISRFVGTPALRHYREHYRMAGLLQDYYFVYGVWVPAYVLEKGAMGTVLEITGRMENVKIGLYIHAFVNRFIDFQWEEYTKRKKLNRSRKTDFALGIIEGFRKKLDGAAEERGGGETPLSLVKAEDRGLEEDVAYRYPHLRKIRGWEVQRDEKVLRDGMEIGARLVIHKGVEERSGCDKGALPLKRLRG
jgi:hypothetical protein